MRSLALLALALSTPAFAEQCAVTGAPAAWQQTAQHTYVIKGTDITLELRCSMLKSTLSDVEFIRFTGEEEPEEAPPLRTFGAWRGRIWVTNPQGSDLEWRLMKDRYYLHVVAWSSTKIPDRLTIDVNNALSKIEASKAQPGVPADGPRPAGESRR